MNNNTERIDIVIISPTFEERKSIIKFLPNHNHLSDPPKEIYSHPFDEGFIEKNGKKYLIRVVTLGQAGPQVAQDEVERIFHYWNPHYIFLLGVCGGFVKQGVSLFDFIIPTDIIGLERIKKQKKGETPNPDYYHTSDKLRLAIKMYFDDHSHWNSEYACHADGHLISSGFLQAETPQDNESVAVISNLWKVYGIGMEGSGIGKALRNLNYHNWIELRVVMDTADEKSRTGKIKDRNKQKAAELVAKFCFEFLADFISSEYDFWSNKWISIRDDWFLFTENEYNFLEYRGIDVTPVLSAKLKDMYIPRSLSPVFIDDNALMKGKIEIKYDTRGIRIFYKDKIFIMPKKFSIEHIMPKNIVESGLITNHSHEFDSKRFGLKKEQMKEESFSILVKSWKRQVSTDSMFNHEISSFDNHYLLILGEAGCGKSTFLKHLALRVVDYYNKEENRGYIPFYIQLARLQKKKILSYIYTQVEENTQGMSSEGKNWIKHLFYTGKAFLLLDGFDEVTNVEDSKSIINEIKNITEKYSLTPIIMTSRTDMSQFLEPHLEMFPTSQLSKLSIEEEIPKYIERWFSPKRYPRDGERLKKDLLIFLNDKQNIDVQHLAENPLLLTVICAIHGTRGQIPNDKIDLYFSLTKTLLDTWEKIKNIEAPNLIDSKYLRKLLEYIAYNLMLKGETELSPADKEKFIRIYWTDYFKVEESVTFIDKSFQTLNFRPILLIPRNNHSTFFHKSFMEYLCACFINNLNDTSQIWETIKKITHNRNWIDSLVFLFSMIQNHHQVDDLIEKIRESLENEKEIALRSNILILIGRIYSQVEIRHHPTRLNIIDMLIKNLEVEILNDTLNLLYIDLFRQSKFRHTNIDSLVAKIKNLRSDSILDGFIDEFVSKLNKTELLISTIMRVIHDTLNVNIIKISSLKRILKNLEINEKFIQNFGNIPTDITPIINKISQHGLLFVKNDDNIEKSVSFRKVEESFLKEQKDLDYFFASIYKSIAENINTTNVDHLSLFTIGDFIHNFTNIKKLNIFRLNFKEEIPYDYTYIPNIEMRSKNIQEFRISGCTITKDFVKQFPTSLKILTLANIKLSEHLDFSTLENLEKLQMISYSLFISGIEPYDEELIASSLESLKTSSKLRELRIFNCFFSFFPESITTLKSIEKLYLRSNCIRSVPQTIKNLSNLKTLDISYNFLSSIPIEISTIQNLTQLDLSHNKLTNIPTWLSKLSKKITVKLEGNPVLIKGTSS